MYPLQILWSVSGEILWYRDDEERERWHDIKKMFLLEHLNEARTEADESRNENLKPYISFQVICLVKYNAVELS